MGRRRRTRSEPHIQRLADVDIFLDRDVPEGGSMPDAGLSLTETSQLLSPDAAGGQPGGGLYRYQNPGKHRRAIEQRYGGGE